MADLNALIAQGAQFRQPESPLNMMAQLQQLQSAQNQNALAQYQLGAAQRADVSKTALNAAYAKAIDPATGKINYTQLTSALAAGGGGAEIPGLLKQQREGMKAEHEAAKAEVDLVDAKLKQSRGLLDTVTTPDAYLAWHEANHADPVLGPVLAARGVTADKARAQIEAALQQPGGFEQLLNQSKLGAEKFIEINKPSIHTQDTGAFGRLVSIPGLGGAATVVPGSQFTKTMTPGEAARLPLEERNVAAREGQLDVSKGNLEVSKGQLKVSQGQLKVAQDRLAREGAGLDPAEQAAVSKAIIDGRIDPTKINGRNAKIMAGALLANPDVNIKELGIEAAGAGAGARALGTQGAKILTAANEAGQMVDVVRDYSNKIDRTQYPTINAIQNAVDKGTGGTEIVKLNTAINALVNSYARAINPTGVATVSDKNHAREIINSSYGNGQINAILDVMGQEMSIAKSSPGEAAKQLKTGRTAASAAPAATKSGATVSNW
jgi:hypothetical protein